MGLTFVDLCEMAEWLLDRSQPNQGIILSLEFQIPNSAFVLTLGFDANKGSKAASERLFDHYPHLFNPFFCHFAS